MKTYQSFREFYHYYLTEHQNRTCRRLHILGTSLAILLGLSAVFFQNPWPLVFMPVAGYFFARMSSREK